MGGKKQAQEVNRRIAPYVNVMLGNEEDFSTALGYDVPGMDKHLSKFEVDGFKQMIAKVVKDYPLQAVATTLRKAKTATLNDWGAICYCEVKFYQAKNRENLEIFDRVGGGDSFASGLIYGFLSGKDPQWAVECEQTCVTDRTALGGIGVDCGAVQTDVAQGQPPHCLGGQEAGHKKVWQCGQNGCTHVGHGVMRRMEATRKAVERYRRGGRPCNRAGPAGAGGVARQPQTSKHVRCEGRATAWTLMGVESTQVQWRDHVDDEACHMVRRQTCAEHDGGIEGCFVIGGCAFSAHVPSVRCVSACGQRVLSDRLLAPKNARREPG